MFVVKPVFLDYLPDGTQTGTVTEKVTNGIFPVIESQNVDRLIQILAARHNCVSVGIDQQEGFFLEVVNDKD